MNEQDPYIIRRILDGDINAYSLIVARYKDKAFGLALSMCGNTTDAEEVVHEAFVRAYKSLRSFRAESRFSTWFYRIVYNQGLTKTSSRKVEHNRFEALPDDDIMASGTSTPLDEFESAEFANIVENALDTMPAQYKTILTLFLVQDLGYQDIVDVTGMPLGTVKTQLHRARKLLRERVLRQYRFHDSATECETVTDLKE